MIDLKITDQEIKEKKDEMKNDACCIGDGMDDRIPWNLNFSLNDRELKKLGISSETAKVGSEIKATVILRVRRMEQHEEEGAEKKGSIGVAVVGMDISKSNSSSAEMADKLYS